jgi:hypothetical protein
MASLRLSLDLPFVLEVRKETDLWFQNPQLDGREMSRSAKSAAIETVEAEEDMIATKAADITGGFGSFLG